MKSLKGVWDQHYCLDNKICYSLNCFCYEPFVFNENLIRSLENTNLNVPEIYGSGHRLELHFLFCPPACSKVKT